MDRTFYFLCLYRDYQATVRIMFAGKAPALRHTKSTHGVSISWVNVGTYRPLLPIIACVAVLTICMHCAQPSFTVKTSVHGSGARSCFHGPSITVVQHPPAFLRVSRTSGGVFGQHLAEVNCRDYDKRRASSTVESIHNENQQDGNRS